MNTKNYQRSAALALGLVVVAGCSGQAPETTVSQTKPLVTVSPTALPAEKLAEAHGFYATKVGEEETSPVAISRALVNGCTVETYASAEARDAVMELFRSFGGGYSVGGETAGTYWAVWTESGTSNSTVDAVAAGLNR